MSADAVRVMLATEGGGFTSPVDYLLTSHPSSVMVGDVNGDGKPDVVASLSGSVLGISVLLGTGHGALVSKGDNETGDLAVALRDLNGDGKPDLVAINVESRAVSVHLGKGDQTFATARTTATQADSVLALGAG